MATTQDSGLRAEDMPRRGVAKAIGAASAVPIGDEKSFKEIQIQLAPCG